MSEYKKAGSTIVRAMSLKPAQLGQYKRNANRKIRSFLYDRYVITFQTRGYNPRLEGWKKWRDIKKVPILFKSYDEAKAYLDTHGFKNIAGRKASASIGRINVKEKANG